jgi:hypothetical protein
MTIASKTPRPERAPSPADRAAIRGGPNRPFVPLVVRDDYAPATILGDDNMRFLGIDLDLLTPAERRDLANALLRAAWSAALEDTRILLLDLLLEVDEASLGGAA